MLALEDGELTELERWRQNALMNGITDVELLSAASIRERYPLAPPWVRGGLLIPRESITCTFSAVIALAEQAAVNGVTFSLGNPALDIIRVNTDRIAVKTARGVYSARWLIDAAGLWADEVAAWAGIEGLRLSPRKGEFLVIDKSARSKISYILLPVPTQTSKGILVTPTVYGNVLLGPTADDIRDKHDRAVSAEGLRRVRERALRLAPTLAEEPVIASYAGLRAVPDSGDYYIDVFPRERLIIAGGIRSTGLSSALAIGRYVVQMLCEQGESLALDGPLQPRPAPAWVPGKPRPCTVAERVAANPRYGRVVCLCELVSEEEIRSALHRPIPVHTVDAVRKRTWATAGRCQGFYCLASILRIASEELGTQIATLTKGEEGSWLVYEPSCPTREKAYGNRTIPG
jgi:glycerol-3-phosphate dehydrogenase